MKMAKQEEIRVKFDLAEVSLLKQELQRMSESIKELSMEVQDLRNESKEMKLEKLEKTGTTIIVKERESDVTEKKVTWEVDDDFGDYDEKLSPVFEHANWPFKLQAKAETVYRSLHVSITFIRLDSPIESVFQLPPTITYTLTDPNDQCPWTKDLVRVANVNQGEQIEFDKFVCQCTLVNVYSGCKYSKDGKLSIGISLTQPQPASTNGILNWRIDEYNRKRTMFRAGVIKYVESPHFYTSANGYRIKVQLVPSDNIEVHVQFIAGEFDSQLPPTLPHLMNVVICNVWKEPSKKHIFQSTIQELTKSYKRFHMNLTTYNELEKSDFLYDDKLHLIVTVIPLEINLK